MKYIEHRDENEDFLNHCIPALQSQDLFSEIVYQKMLEIFLDFNENEDSRMNAFSIVYSNTPPKDLIRYLETLQKDPNPLFVKNSIRWINDLKSYLKTKNLKVDLESETKKVIEFKKIDESSQVDYILDVYNENTFLNDNSKWKFFIELLNNKSIYDLAKIEIYKIIEVHDFKKEEIIEIKNENTKSFKERR